MGGQGGDNWLADMRFKGNEVESYYLVLYIVSDSKLSKIMEVS